MSLVIEAKHTGFLSVLSCSNERHMCLSLSCQEGGQNSHLTYAVCALWGVVSPHTPFRPHDTGSMSAFYLSTVLLNCQGLTTSSTVWFHQRPHSHLPPATPQNLPGLMPVPALQAWLASVTVLAFWSPVSLLTLAAF